MRWLDDLGQVEGEPPDAKERLAEVMADVRRRGPREYNGGGPPQARCGTRSGYERHRRMKQKACDKCKAAERDRQRRLRV